MWVQQGCALHLPKQRQRQRQRQRQKQAIRGMAGRCRIAGTPQVRPCRLGRQFPRGCWWVPTVGRHGVRYRYL